MTRVAAKMITATIFSFRSTYKLHKLQIRQEIVREARHGIKKGRDSDLKATVLS